MRKSLAALVLIISMGVTSPGGVLAAKPVASAASHDPAAGVSGGAIVQYAMKFLGYPYTATGDSPSTGFSCIGFVSYVYRSLGINLPGDLGGALAFAPQVSFSQLQPGDVLYFQNTVWAGLSHAAIYIGGGKFINAEWYNRGVVISSFTNDPIDSNYWSAHYLGANRPWIGATSVPVAAPTAIPPVRSVAPIPAPRVLRSTNQATVHVPFRPTAVVRVSALNVRSGPSISASLDSVIMRGARVIVLGSRHGGYRIARPSGSVGGVIGMGIGHSSVLRSGFRTRSRSTNGRSIGARQRTVATVTRLRTSARRVLSRVRTYGTVSINVNGLRVHTAPSLGAAVLGSLSRSQHLAVVRSVGGWVDVRLPSGRFGWISQQFTSRRQAGTAGATTQIMARGKAIVTAGVRIHWSPGVSKPTIGLVAAGTHVQVLHSGSGWTKVRLPSRQTGYILGIYVKQ